MDDAKVQNHAVCRRKFIANRISPRYKGRLTAHTMEVDEQKQTVPETNDRADRQVGQIKCVRSGRHQRANFVLQTGCRIMYSAPLTPQHLRSITRALRDNITWH
jgi:hypothetical protein